MSLQFDRRFDGHYDTPDWLGPRLRRLTAHNPGPFTFTGTNTYLIGTGEIALVDPGPDDQTHFENLCSAIRGETLTHIFVTHTHVDHSPLARKLADAIGATICARGPHYTAQTWHGDGPAPLEDSNDLTFKPDHALRDGETVRGRDWALQAIATPGHMANHMCFALDGDEALFSGDHIMAWSSSIVAPPDGDMQAYIQSLHKIAAIDWKTIWPAHGGPIVSPQKTIAAHIAHRLAREKQITNCLSESPKKIMPIVEAIYTHLPLEMHGAAALNVFAHLQDLCARGVTSAAPDVSFEATYTSNQSAFVF